MPSTHASGASVRHGCIIKEGSRWLRWVMVEAAQAVIVLLFGVEEQAPVRSDLSCSSRTRCHIMVDVSAIEGGLDAKPQCCGVVCE